MAPEQTRAPTPDPQTSDHDEPYTWGRPPSTYLSLHQVVRLTILRSHLRERASDLDAPASLHTVQEVIE